MIRHLRKSASKSAFILSTILVVAIGIGIYSYFFSKPALASWFNESWLYRQTVAITNSSSAQTNFQVKLLSNYDMSALVTANKLQSDLDDIRFTDLNGKILKYWIEDATNNSVDIWVSIPSVPASGATIYMYYGNSSAQKGSSIAGTSDFPGLSCKAVKLSGGSANAIYYVDPNGGNPSDAFQTYCELTIDGGGWTILISHPASASTQNPLSDYGSVGTSGNYSIWSKASLFTVDSYIYKPLYNANLWATATKGVNAWNAPVAMKYTDTNGNVSTYNSTAQVYVTGGSPSYSAGCSGYTPNGGYGLVLMEYPPSGWCTHTGYGFGLSGGDMRGCHYDSWMWNWGSSPGGGLQCPDPAQFKTGNALVGIRENAITVPSSVVSVAAPASEEKGPGSVAYWKFDEGNGVKTQSSVWQKAGTTTNSVTNPSFENNVTTGWSVYDPDSNPGSSVTKDTTRAVFGTASSKITNGSPMTYNYTNYNLPSFNVSNNQTVTFSVWLYRTSSSTSSYLRFWDNTNNAYRGSSSQSQTNAWERVSLSWTNTTGGTVSVQASVFNTTSSASTWADGAQLEFSAMTIYCDGSLLGNGSHAWTGTAHASTSTCDYGNDGEINGATWTTEDQCVAGKCLKFDGTTNYVNIPSNAGIPTGSSARSVSMWVRTTDNSWTADVNNLFEYGSGSTRQAFGIDLDTFPNIQVWTWADDATVNTGLTAKSGWWHIEVVYDGGTTITTYINGQLKNTKTLGGTLNTGSTSVNIGRATLVANDYFDGFIDEPKIYPYARSAAQIKQDYASGKANSGTKQGNTASLGAKPEDWLSNGLVGYWKMDEASWNTTAGQVLDASGNSNNGTSAGNATTAAGKFGNGGTFDGTGDYVSISSITGNSSTQTVSTWIYVVGAVSGNQYVIDQGGNNNWIQVYNSHIRAGTSGSYYCDGSATLTTSTWYHVTKVFNGTTLSVYLNGALDCSASASASTPGAIRIGDYSSGGYGLNGKIDDVRIYNRVLSPKEVSDLYNWAPGPVGYWNMEEKSGTTVSNQGSCSDCNGTSAGITFTQGKYGGGYDMQPSISNYWYVPANTKLDVDAQFTVEAWGTYDAVSRYGLFANNTVENQFNPYVNGTTFTVMGTTLSGGSLTPGQWFHASVSYDGSSYRLYINGILVNTDSTTAAKDFSGCWVFGQEVDGGGNCTSGFDATQSWDGKMDDIRIYNYARTAKQIVQDMNGSHPSVGSPVGSSVAYWKFDEGQGVKASSSIWNKAGSLTNINTNPSLETASTGYWSAAYNPGGHTTSSSARVSTQASEGSYSWNEVDTGGNGVVQTMLQRIAVSPATAYTASAWVKVSSLTSGSVRLGMVYWTAGWGYEGETWTNTITAVTNGWVRLTISGTTGASTAWLDVRSEHNGTGANYFVDGVQLETGSTPRSYCDGSLVGNGSHVWTGTAHASTSTCDWGNDGDINGATWSQAGKFGKALSFDGGDYLINTSSLDVTGGGTISVWFKTTTPASTQVLVGNSSGSNTNGFVCGLYNSKILCNPQGTGVSGALTTSKTVDTNWHHMVAVKDSTPAVTKIYLDGVDVSSSSNLSYFSVGTTVQTRIGRALVDGDGSFFTGLIDEVKVYNYQLTADEVKTDYNRGQSIQMGALGTNSTYQAGAANQEYCIPGDATSCTAPIGRWDFEEKSGTSYFDSSGYGKTATLSNGTPSSSTGKYGSAVNFKASTQDSLLTGAVTDNYSGGISASAWIFPVSTGASQQMIIIAHGSSLDTFGFALGYAVNKPSIHRGSWASNGRAWSCSVAGCTIPLNQWTHVAFTTTGGATDAVNFYINGVLVSSPTPTTTWGAGNVGTDAIVYRIGGWGATCGTNCFNGKIDDLRIFNYVRTPAQIAYDYNKGKPIGWWKFDECQGTTANDSIGTNTGTITIGTGGGTGHQDSAGTCTASATTAWYDGRIGKRNASLNFDGIDDYVNIPENTIFDGTTGTWSLWFKIPSASAGNGYGIMGKADNPSSYNGITIYEYLGILSVAVKNGSAGILNVTASNIADNNWHHVVFTFTSGTNYAFYVDGVLKSSGALGSFTFTTQPIRLGKLLDTYWQALSGSVDDVKIFNYALTATQVKNEFNGGAINYAPVTGSP